MANKCDGLLVKCKLCNREWHRLTPFDLCPKCGSSLYEPIPDMKNHYSCIYCQKYSADCTSKPKYTYLENGCTFLNVKYQPKPEAQDKTLEGILESSLNNILSWDWQNDPDQCMQDAKIEILSAIQSKYVLLAENQTPPRNPYKALDSSFGAGSYEGFRACYAIMTTPILNPDGTYDVWAKVRVTKDQMEKLDK